MNEDNSKAFQIIKDSGILNEDITLREVLETCEELAALDTCKDSKGYTERLVHPRYVFEHDK
ncbi:hypothetical protein COL23_13535 [Priestia aryabhattai]|uniref:hypothetical protein n=1 Tax=Priestia aryabhattai TaxID=412384 RepID=UPI000BF450F3|nr:hypothetical protein [Priestia aryabhattai]PFW75848.1 hypothetical protein COL23_13535 [Priestia aryabhattai]